MARRAERRAAGARKPFIAPAIAIGGGLAVGTAASMLLEANQTPKAERLAADHESWRGRLDEHLAKDPEPGDPPTLSVGAHTKGERLGLPIFGSTVAAVFGGLGAWAALAEGPRGLGIAALAVAAVGVGGIAGTLIGYHALD